MEVTKPKFILTTKSLFITSFILFSLMSVFFFLSLSFSSSFDFFGEESSIRFFDVAALIFFISIGFYALMPLFRFIVNFRKIETEEEKKSVSGFFIRYFGGFAVSFLIIFLPGAGALSGLNDFFIYGILTITIFYIVSIFTLFENNFLDELLKPAKKIILTTRFLFTSSLILFSLSFLMLILNTFTDSLVTKYFNNDEIYYDTPENLNNEDFENYQYDEDYENYQYDEDALPLIDESEQSVLASTSINSNSIYEESLLLIDDILTSINNFLQQFSVIFYILLPLFRLLINYKKVETPEEVLCVSGFYTRYFLGLVIGFVIMGAGLNSADGVILFSIAMLIFHLIALKTLKSKVYWVEENKI
jgi:hypothetical protein